MPDEEGLPPIAGTLYVVSTPIGHLEDITHRAVRTLATVQTILCEDTRHSRRLLDRYAITTHTEALHEHNEASAAPRIVARLTGGEQMALVSDAGTPLVSDPGARLISAAVAAGVRVVPVPGASAVLAALVGSGMGGGAFTFLGFLDRKGAGRQKQLALISRLPHPSVVYEAPGRVVATLRDLAGAGMGERPVAVAREVSKQFEEFVRGTVLEVVEYYGDESPRGEVVIVVGGASEEVVIDAAELARSVEEMRARGERPRDIARALVDRFGVARNDAYRLALGE